MAKVRLKIFIFGVLGVCVILAGLFQSYRLGLWRINYVSAEEFPVQGLDVSHHQGDIRWSEVPHNRFQFVYMKATEGGDFKDRKFTDNWRQARDAGFEAGAYHFFTLCRSGADQAENFMETVPVETDALAPVIDLEFVGNCKKRPDKNDFLKELQTYSSEIQTAYARQPVLYTTYEFFDLYLKNTEFAGYPLWIRDVWKRPSRADVAYWHIWQYADNAIVPGIDGPVDLNAAANKF